MNTIITIITRRKIFEKFYLTTNSIKSDYDGKWSNCLYLHFTKEDFQNIEYPKLIDNNSPFMKNYKKRFYYFDTNLNELPFHGGITFYEEFYNPETQKTYVKVGCDYQHLYDDEYRMEDNGEMILNTDGENLANAFIKFTNKHDFIDRE